MKCLHRTPHADKILANGFRDGEGTYMTGTIHEGVWFSDRPLGLCQGTKEANLLSIEIPDEMLEQFEWIEEGKPYREFMIPAEIVNRLGKPVVCDEDEMNWRCQSAITNPFQSFQAPNALRKPTNWPK